MRSQFIVIAKLIGLFMFSGILGGISVSVRIISNFSSTAVGSGWAAPTGLVLFLSLVILLLLLGVAWTLIIRTEWLADKLSVVVKDDGESGARRATALLKVGVKLVGLYIIASSVTSLLSEVVDVVWWPRLIGYYAERGISYSITVGCADDREARRCQGGVS